MRRIVVRMGKTLVLQRLGGLDTSSSRSWQPVQRPLPVHSRTCKISAIRPLTRRRDRFSQDPWPSWRFPARRSGSPMRTKRRSENGCGRSHRRFSFHRFRSSPSMRRHRSAAGGLSTSWCRRDCSALRHPRSSGSSAVKLPTSTRRASPSRACSIRPRSSHTRWPRPSTSALNGSCGCSSPR
jgi:hypothetical protein